MKTKKSKAKGGFSLVELSIALAVVSFCLTTLLALITVGIMTSRDAIQRTVASNVICAIASDLRNAPASGSASGQSPQFNIAIPASGGTAATVQTLYFADNGSLTGAIGSTPVSSGNSPSAYRVTVMVYPPAASQIGPTGVRILVSWPALSDAVPTQWPTKYKGSVEYMTDLDRN